LTNLLSATIKIQNVDSVTTLKPNEIVDLSLSMEGGLLGQISLILDDQDSLSKTLLCPGYGNSEEDMSGIQRRDEQVSVVPEPGQTEVLSFHDSSSGILLRAILRSTLSSYRTLRLQISPLVTLCNMLNIPAIFQVRSRLISKYQINFSYITVLYLVGLGERVASTSTLFLGRGIN